MTSRTVILVASIVTFVFGTSVSTLKAQEASDTSGVRIRRSGDICAVTINGASFTDLHLAGFRRPILYPVYGPSQTPMTRSFPMQAGVAGEQDDHPHHKSIWCGHGLINEVSFWHEQGRIAVNQKKPIGISVTQNDRGASGSVKFSTDYFGPDEKLMCTDETTLTFYEMENGRAIDWDVTIQASEVDLLFGDTKEGMMATRTHPSLRIDRGAVAVNSDGVSGKDIWGKPAKWVDYSGKVDGKHVGVAIFDHPENLRHPTTWHARAYGLVAANPFGLHHFQGKPKGAGNHTVKKGDAIRFRYRFVFHVGDAQAAGISKQYDAFAIKK